MTDPELQRKLADAASARLDLERWVDALAAWRDTSAYWVGDPVVSAGLAALVDIAAHVRHSLPVAHLALSADYCPGISQVDGACRRRTGGHYCLSHRDQAPVSAEQLEQARREGRAEAWQAADDARRKYIDAARTLWADHDSLVYRVGVGRLWKIGRTTNLAQRLTSIRSGKGCLMPHGLDPSTVDLAATVLGGGPLEVTIHRALQSRRLTGEWFDIDRRSERVLTGYGLGLSVGGRG